MVEKSLSVCMIVKNEAHQLEEILRQVKPVADEIVVVDTGSEDDTVKIAKRYTPFVFFFPWQNDFSLARNFALEKARGDYFLWLDADDRLPEESVKKISLLKNYFDGKTFFSFILEDIQNGKVHSRFYQVRCAPLRKNIRFRYRIHEELISSLKEGGYRGARTDIVIRHHGYSEPEVLREKMERNLKLLTADFDLRKDSVDYIYLLAISHLYFERYDEASSILKEYIRQHRFSSDNLAVWGEIYRLLAHIEIARNNKGEALRYLIKSEVAGVSGRAEWYRLGCAYESIDELHRAYRAFERALSAPYVVGCIPTIPEPGDWEIFMKKSAVLLRLDRFEEAGRYLEEAIKSAGTDVISVVERIIGYFIELEDYDISRKILNTVLFRHISSVDLNFYTALILLFEGNIEISLKLFYGILKENNLHINTRRAIALGYLLKGNYRRALRLYRELIMEGLVHEDVVAGGMLSGLIMGKDNLKDFAKILRNVKGMRFEKYGIEEAITFLHSCFKSKGASRDVLTFLFLKLILKAFRNENF